LSDNSQNVLEGEYEIRVRRANHIHAESVH